MTLASVAAQQSSTAPASAAQTALTGLSSNFQDFLSLLMTQLQNQDPTSPLDTNQFTSELVQFSSVEQQIATNSSLTQLIQLTQSGEMLQSASIVGHQVALASTDLVLQDGGGAIRFNAAAAGPVAITVRDANGGVIGTASVTAAQGSNVWQWDGSGANGVQYPDGAYGVSVASIAANGTATALPFSVLAQVSGVEASGSSLQLDLGAITAPFSEVTSIAD